MGYSLVYYGGIYMGTLGIKHKAPKTALKTYVFFCTFFALCHSFKMFEKHVA